MIDIINFQNSTLYYIARQVLGWIFYALLAIYVFYKIYNMYLIKNLNCKDEYIKKRKKLTHIT